MTNKENLIPQAHVLTVEEQSQGGKKSGETRRLQGAIKRALEAKATSAEFEALFENFGIEKEGRDYAAAIGCIVIQKAAKGDLSAIGFVRDTIGEKPKEEISLDGGVVILDDLANKA